MGGDELKPAPEASDASVDQPPRVLCYVNHYFGPSPHFHGKSTTQPPDARRAVVERTLASLRKALPGATIRVCGIPGRALVPLDEEFRLADPRLLVYESLDRMAGHLDEYDWFVNVEDDIELTPQTFRNALEFEAESLPNECLLPNRLEQRPDGLQNVDAQTLPGWTYQERRVLGHVFRVAVNPHSALLMLPRKKFAFALRHVDRAFRGHVVGGLMASAYAHFHKPLSLYRCFDDPEFHSVIHLGGYDGPLAPGAAADFSAILLSWKRPHNLPVIMDSLRQMAQIREVLVWNNDPSRKLKVPGAVVIDAPRNFMCLARYCLVPLARYDNIWFQDDDLLLRPHQFAALAAEYASDTSRIYGARGRNLRDGRYVFEDVWGEVDIVLGQTMMFHRSLLRNAFATLGELPPPTMEDDIVFSLSGRRKHRAVNLEPIEDLGTWDDAALFRQPGHAEKRQAAVDRLLAHFAAHPPAEERLRAELEQVRAGVPPLQAELEQVRAELQRLRDQHAQLAGSATVRAANAVKRLPLIYPAYLRGKRFLQSS